MDKNTFLLHTSDIRKFKQCRRLWRYSSPLFYNKTPGHTPDYFTRGKVVHKGMEEYYTNGADGCADIAIAEYLQVVKNERARGYEISDETAAEEIDLLESMFDMYPSWAWKNDNFKVLEMEKRYSVPLISTPDLDVLFTFRCDQVVERKNGLWIHDFKTTSSLPTDPTFLDFDEQITGYLKACELVYGKPFVGAIFTYLLAKVPTEPEVLKNGSLSVSKKIVTTPKVYYRKLLELGLDPSLYKEFLQHLNNSRQWFVRFEVLKTRAEKDILWTEHQQLAYEMIKPDLLTYKSPTPMGCQLCSFKMPCLLESAGRDFEKVLETEYINAEEW